MVKSWRIGEKGSGEMAKFATLESPPVASINGNPLEVTGVVINCAQLVSNALLDTSCHFSPMCPMLPQ